VVTTVVPAAKITTAVVTIAINAPCTLLLYFVVANILMDKCPADFAIFHVNRWKCVITTNERDHVQRNYGGKPMASFTAEYSG
jgi:hypothetical protein